MLESTPIAIPLTPTASTPTSTESRKVIIVWIEAIWIGVVGLRSVEASLGGKGYFSDLFLITFFSYYIFRDRCG